MQSRGRQVRVGSTSGSDCVNTESITTVTSAIVEFECNSGQVIMPPCIQYFNGGCSSMVFTGMEFQSITRHGMTKFCISFGT